MSLIRQPDWHWSRSSVGTLTAVYTPKQAYLFFDPPVRRLAFSYDSRIGDGYGSSLDSVPDDRFEFRVSDQNNFTILRDTIRVNFPEPGTMTRVDIATGAQDRIYKVFFNGRMRIDDLVIERAAEPVLECEAGVVRGASATCTVDSDEVDEVQAWHFAGFIPLVGNVQVDTAMAAYSWSGRVALSGIVSVDVLINDSTRTFQDSLIVQPRSLSSAAWAWDSLKWHYDPEGGKQCHPGYGPFHFPSVFDDSIPTAENSSTESCLIGTFTPRSNDIAVFEATYRADSIYDGGPNQGLFFVDSARYAMKHGSYYNPFVRPTAPGDSVTSSSNLKDCKAGKHVTSLVKNLHQFNLDCTKPPEQGDFADWWAAVERHEGFGTPGMGPSDNGHEAQRRLAAGQPGNNPYEYAEKMVGQSRSQLRNLLSAPVFAADVAIQDAAKHGGPNDVVHGNWGTLNAVGQWCGEIFVYKTNLSPKAFAKETICGT